MISLSSFFRFIILLKSASYLWICLFTSSSFRFRTSYSLGSTGKLNPRSIYTENCWKSMYSSLLLLNVGLLRRVGLLLSLPPWLSLLYLTYSTRLSISTYCARLSDFGSLLAYCSAAAIRHLRVCRQLVRSTMLCHRHRSSEAEAFAFPRWSAEEPSWEEPALSQSSPVLLAVHMPSPQVPPQTSIQRIGCRCAAAQDCSSTV